MITKRLPVVAVAALAGAVFSGSALAQAKVWNFSDTTSPGFCNSAGFTGVAGNTLGCTAQGSAAGSPVSLNLNAFSINTVTAGSTYAAAIVNSQGANGVGITHINPSEAGGSPDHSIDNNAGYADMLLLSFTSAQVLKTVTLGWSYSDADFQVLRWTGGAFTSPTAQTAAGLLGGATGVNTGWDLVTTVDGISTSSNDGTDRSYDVNAGNASSSYWLISAYNSAFGGATLNGGVDGMKLLSVSANSVSVSEPGSLALAGLAMAGLAGLRRRTSTATA